uniref:Uncharacterized protein n=2 Tax=Aegilops tauschii subsp. strangulata TaxID=200361 RepID=A0A453PCD5_AEGTS
QSQIQKQENIFLHKNILALQYRAASRIITGLLIFFLPELCYRLFKHRIRNKWLGSNHAKTVVSCRCSEFSDSRVHRSYQWYHALGVLTEESVDDLP